MQEVEAQAARQVTKSGAASVPLYKMQFVVYWYNWIIFFPKMLVIIVQD